jgi:hypothetical protein
MKLDEILRAAQQVGRHTTYPITSADQLVNALGGEHATQRIGGKDHQAAEVRQIPCAGYLGYPFYNREVNSHAGNLNETYLECRLQRKTRVELS